MIATPVELLQQFAHAPDGARLMRSARPDAAMPPA